MIAAIGAFDGFHRGHRTLLDRARQRADELMTSWGIVTFARHPERLIGSGTFKSLFTRSEQIFLERYFGVPNVCRIDFTPEIAGMAPGDFLDFISGSFDVLGVVVGEDFRFGRCRAGDPELLEREGKIRHWPVDVMPILKTSDGVMISSTEVRNSIIEGDFAYAWKLLGYPFFCSGKIEHGKGRGRELGFPTANVALPDEKIGIPDGVYATMVFDGSKWYIGAANFGNNPTFSDIDSKCFEVNLIGYDGDLYGRDLTVFVLDRLRGETRFENSSQLAAQINLDVERTTRIGMEALANHKALWNGLEAALLG